MNSKITEQHQNKPAYIYVRQSTMAQVRHHQESTERQYALRQKALELGWTEDVISTLECGLASAVAAVCADTDSRNRRRWLLRSSGFQRWTVVGAQGDDGASGVALSARAPPGR